MRRRAQLPRRGDRGATLVEYALLVALVVVVSIGAIQTLQQNGEEKLDESDERISAVDGAYYPGAPTTSTTAAPTTSTTMGGIAVHLQPGPTVSVANDGPRWQVTLTFTLVDTSGNGVIGATLQGSWTGGGGGSDPVSTCSTSTSSGQCTVQFTDIHDNVQDVTYTVSSISGGTFVWSPAAVDEGTVTVNCGTAC